MLTFKIWHIGHYSSEKWFGHHDTKLSVGRYENLMKEVNKLTHTLVKAYGGEDRLLMCLGSQRASLYKERLGYTPKKGKAAFAPHKTCFVKDNGRFCISYKQVGHKEHECTNKSKNANVSFLKLDSCYMLTKGINSVKAKFIGKP